MQYSVFTSASHQFDQPSLQDGGTPVEDGELVSSRVIIIAPTQELAVP